jgi:hypothetical protein
MEFNRLTEESYSHLHLFRPEASSQTDPSHARYPVKDGRFSLCLSKDGENDHLYILQMSLLWARFPLAPFVLPRSGDQETCH